MKDSTMDLAERLDEIWTKKLIVSGEVEEAERYTERVLFRYALILKARVLHAERERDAALKDRDLLLSDPGRYWMNVD